MAVAACRPPSRSSRGRDSAGGRPWPLARSVALVSCPAARRRAAIRLSDARLELAEHAFDALAVGACREGERHAVLEDPLGRFPNISPRACLAHPTEPPGTHHTAPVPPAPRQRAPADFVAHTRECH